MEKTRATLIKVFPVQRQTSDGKKLDSILIFYRDENGETYHWSVVNTVDVAPSGSAYVKVVSGDNKGLIRWNATYYLDKFDTEVIWSRYPK